MTHFKSVFAATVAASLFLGNFEFTSVGAVAPAVVAPAVIAPTRLLNDLDNPSPERDLYNALVAKGIDVVEDMTFSPRGIRSLKKFMNKLLAVDPNLLNAAINTMNHKRLQLEVRVKRLVREIEELYHRDSTVKHVQVRNVIEKSTVCLRAILAAINVVTGGLDGRRDIFASEFDHALRQIKVLCDNDNRGPQSVQRMYDEYWRAKAGSATKVAIEDNIRQIGEVVDAITLLAMNVVDKTTPESWSIFHFLYSKMCDLGMGRHVFDYCVTKDLEFERHYDEWLADKGKVKPVNTSN
ncbi:MAG: hypothetical protein LBB21_00175 [Holosporaceae bacterium]|jgi:hypothetical protein|nr:hypothetical protein [Holosporaceae bacterium]